MVFCFRCGLGWFEELAVIVDLVLVAGVVIPGFADAGSFCNVVANFVLDNVTLNVVVNVNVILGVDVAFVINAIAEFNVFIAIKAVPLFASSYSSFLGLLWFFVGEDRFLEMQI